MVCNWQTNATTTTKKGYDNKQKSDPCPSKQKMKIKASETRKGEFCTCTKCGLLFSFQNLSLASLSWEKKMFSFSVFFSAWTLYFLFTFINMDLHNCHANNYVFFSCVLFCLHSFFLFTWLVLRFFLYLFPFSPPEEYHLCETHACFHCMCKYKMRLCTTSLHHRKCHHHLQQQHAKDDFTSIKNDS